MFKNKTKERQGELFVLGSAPLWSLFPIISILVINGTSPLFTAAFSTLISTICFAIILTYKKRWHEIRIKEAWRPIIYSTLIIGVLFYSLVFIGLQKTTAGNASIIALMEVFFTFLIFRIWKKEKQKKQTIIGAAFMIIGAILILYQGSLSINEGDLILFIAYAIPPIGNYFNKEARKKVSSATIMLSRGIIGGIFMLALAFTFEPSPTSAQFQNALPLLLINGLFLLGLSKIFWLEGIHRISVSKAISLSTINPGLTLIFAFFILGDVPTIWQILGYIPMSIGLLQITQSNRNVAKVDEL